mmetsp:Transcript_17331/g.48279  ORF Transcript_17331/g.48279 Transcript_17331/m.48279 type:complete len:201 (+) Transcript_17331:935-1537(+)
MSRPLPWVIRLSSSLEMGEGPGAVSSSAGRMSVVPSLGSAGTLARLYSMTSTTASSSVSDLISNSSCWPMRCRHRGLLNITWSARSCSAPTVLRATAMVPKAMVETTPRGPCGGLAPRLPLLPPSPISARNSFTSGGSMPPSSSSSPASSLSSGGPAEAPCVPVTRERTVRILRRVSSLAVRRLTIAALISNLSAASSMS